MGADIFGKKESRNSEIALNNLDRMWSKRIKSVLKRGDIALKIDELKKSGVSLEKIVQLINMIEEKVFKEKNCLPYLIPVDKLWGTSTLKCEYLNSDGLGKNGVCCLICDREGFIRLVPDFEKFLLFEMENVFVNEQDKSYTFPRKYLGQLELKGVRKFRLPFEGRHAFLAPSFFKYFCSLYDLMEFSFSKACERLINFEEDSKEVMRISPIEPEENIDHLYKATASIKHLMFVHSYKSPKEKFVSLVLSGRTFRIVKGDGGKRKIFEIAFIGHSNENSTLFKEFFKISKLRLKKKPVKTIHMLARKVEIESENEDEYKYSFEISDDVDDTFFDENAKEIAKVLNELYSSEKVARALFDFYLSKGGLLLLVGEIEEGDFLMQNGNEIVVKFESSGLKEDSVGQNLRFGFFAVKITKSRKKSGK